MRKSIGLILMLVLCFACRKQEGEKGKFTIAVIPKSTTSTFWQTVQAGAIKASREFDVELVWVGPEREDERQRQIAIVDNQVINQVSGISLAPVDDMALRRPAKAAADKQIPVLIYDSDLQDSGDFTLSFVATDNLEGGRVAARNLAKMLDGSGKVILLRYAEGSASTEQRESGFLDMIAEYPKIEVISDEQYAGPTPATGQQASENLLIRFKDANGNLTVDGIFCPNESSTYGMLQALRRNRLAGKVKFIGFDSNEPLVEAVRKGEIDGLVVQNPFNMGYLAVKVMYQHLSGEQVPKRIDTGVTFVSKKNIDRPEVHELLNPDLAKWLN